jgi:hypothetical protein
MFYWVISKERKSTLHHSCIGKHLFTIHSLYHGRFLKVNANKSIKVLHNIYDAQTTL